MKILKTIAILVLIVGIATISFAQETKRVAKIAELKGSAEVKSAGKELWVAAKAGMILNQSDIIRTKAKSSMLINLNGMAQTATVEMQENSQLSIAELIKNETKSTQTTLLDLAMGKILIKAQKLSTEASKFEVKTPTSIVGVRGTSFAVTVEAAE